MFTKATRGDKETPSWPNLMSLLGVKKDRVTIPKSRSFTRSELGRMLRSPSDCHHNMLSYTEHIYRGGTTYTSL